MITNDDAYINISELGEYIADLEQYAPNNEDLQNLKYLKSQLFIDDGILVHEDCILEYTQDMVSECYHLPDLPWFMEIIIHYEALIDDYTIVEYNGVKYYIV